GSDPEVALFDAKQALSGNDPYNNKAIQFGEAAIKADRVRLVPYLTIVQAASRAKNWAAADKALNEAQAVFCDNLELGLAKAGRLRDEANYDGAVAALKTMMTAHDQAE